MLSLNGEGSKPRMIGPLDGKNEAPQGIRLRTGLVLDHGSFHLFRFEEKAMIKVGDRLPEVSFRVWKDGKGADMTTSELTKGKKIALFAVPGAFTPTCSAKHLPGYKEKAAEFRKKGIDTIACVSTNDVWVMEAWGRDQKVGEDILMLSDGQGEFTKALGLEVDIPRMGVRSKRYSMIVQDGVVKQFNLEEPGKFEVSSADYMLGQL
jgi:glutaredoxin/glutathione-dependent peroxiredoxin